jgi:hypothetical protein
MEGLAGRGAWLIDGWGLMAGDSSSRDLGDLLERLKVNSGRSYENIGREIHVSKSAVHRYCTGVSVPREFGVVERIGLVCGASRDEMVLLHRLWLRATTTSVDDVSESDEERVSVEGGGGQSPAEPVHSWPVRRLPIRRRRARVLVGFAMVVCLVVLLGSSDERPPTATDQASGQWVSGPAWTLPPASVPSTLFGVTINSGTGAMPAFRVGAVRFWDSGTRWSEIQRQRGEFDWSVLDRLVSGAERVGLPPLFVFGGTPRWASPAGPAGPYPDGTPAPPDDLADWDLFVRTLVQRYRGRIESYELWVLANDRRLYAGTVEKLVEMTRRASGIIRSVDPKAIVVCPGMGQLWNPEGVSFLQSFVALGGYDYCDVAGVKLFQRTASDPPEMMLDLTATIDKVMHEAGIHPRVWNTGTTYSIPLESRLDEVRARNYAVRFFLVGLYARNVNLERMYFYNWGGTKIPIVLQAVGGVPTNAALAVEQLQRWLAHAQSRSCGHGNAANLPNNVWDCEFTITEPGRTYDVTIHWTDIGTATITAGPAAQAVRHLDGSSTTTRPGDPITVTEEPILIESNRSTLH